MNRITASGQQAVILLTQRYPNEILAWNKTIDLSGYVYKKYIYTIIDVRIRAQSRVISLFLLSELFNL